MLSSVSRSRTSYICTQCRTRLLARPTAVAAASYSSTTAAPLLPPLLSRKTFPAVAARQSYATYTTYTTYTTTSSSSPSDAAPDSQTSDKVVGYDEELDLRQAQFGSSSKPWETIGLRPVVADTLLRAFPNALRPTAVQKKMLTALTYGYSVAVRGLPGTGKSFAIAAWLLGLERSLTYGTEVPTTSALVLVPNVDLAVQYHRTILTMLENSDSEAVKSSPDAFVQLLYRKSSDAELEQLRTLKKFPHPHIIIAPATIILDLLADKEASVRDLIDVNHLKVIVLEEVDAAITQMVYYSRLKKGHSMAAQHERMRPRQTPLQILLDYIIKYRLAEAYKRRVAPQQPQLVFPSATLSATQVKRFLVQYHRDWLQAPELNMDNSPSTFRGPKPGEEWRRRARSNSLISVEEPPLVRDSITQYVPDHIRHYVVAYDMRTGTLRDAPLPPMRHLNKEDIVNQVNKNEQIQDAIQDEDTTPEGLRVIEYPEETVLKIVMQLLETDNYPTNVIIGLSPQSDFESIKLGFREMGIKCRMLHAVKWDGGDEPGKLPLGRTDMLLTPSVRDRVESEAKGGDKKVTTLWLTSTFYCRGIQTPGVNHLYILQRITRPREYITYAGRIASWPHAQRADELADPLSMGVDRRPVGKIVSVILEDNVLEHEDKLSEPMEFQRKSGQLVKPMVVKRDGSEEEQIAWSTEAVRLAKLGCKVESYFADEPAGRPKSEAKDEEAVVQPPAEQLREEKKAPADKDIFTELMGLLDDAEAEKEKEKR